MRTETGTAIAFLIGMLLKYLHLPGGGLIVVLSLSTLALIYFPGAFYFFSDKTIARSNITLSIISGFFLSIAPVGILFKLQYWPGADLILVSGMTSAVIFLASALFLKFRASEELRAYYKNMTIRTASLIVVTTVLYFTSTETLVKLQYWNDSELARLKALHYTYPENEEYRREHDQYMARIDSNIQQEILKEEN